MTVMKRKYEWQVPMNLMKNIFYCFFVINTTLILYQYWPLLKLVYWYSQ